MSQYNFTIILGNIETISSTLNKLKKYFFIKDYNYLQLLLSNSKKMYGFFMCLFIFIVKGIIKSSWSY